MGARYQEEVGKAIAESGVRLNLPGGFPRHAESQYCLRLRSERFDELLLPGI